MKAGFTFNLPEENEEYEIYQNAPKMAAVIHEFEMALRHKRKYEEDPKPMTVEEVEELWYKTKAEGDLC